MTPHLTAPNQELERLIRRTPEGMMFWSGTCNDPNATCGGCKYYGYAIEIRNEAGDVVHAREYSTRCELYKKHSGQHGESLSAKTIACKYFEPKP